MAGRTSTILIWVFAFVLTAAAATYQRMTGPTYPVSGSLNAFDYDLTYQLPRSHGGDGDAEFVIPTPTPNIKAELYYKRYPSHDEWTTVDVFRRNGGLRFALPHQPPAGKVMYRIVLTHANWSPVELTTEPVVLRFKGHVPIYIIIPHVLMIFSAMLFSTRTGIEAILKRSNVRTLTLWTTILLFFGGMILGPVVQKFAFGAFWTGWPSGTDLTDNKTAVAFIAWLVALIRVWRHPERRASVIVASFVLFLVYLIPHSMFGSEIDYTQVEPLPPIQTGH